MKQETRNKYVHYYFYSAWVKARKRARCIFQKVQEYITQINAGPGQIYLQILLRSLQLKNKTHNLNFPDNDAL